MEHEGEVSRLVPDERHRRPVGATDGTVEAVGKVTEALEWVERVRGRVYDVHQMIGRADFLFEEAAEALRRAGHTEEAAWLTVEIVGRNVLDGRWTFQIVEEFDECYYQPIREAERQIRTVLTAGRSHVFEAKLKERRRPPTRPYHESRPPGAASRPTAEPERY